MLLPKDFTTQENLIAEVLSNFGLRYDQQVEFGKYRTDFYVKELNMVIEADGIYGHQRKRDIKRDKYLQTLPGVEYIVRVKENTKQGIEELLWQVLDNLQGPNPPKIQKILSPPGS